MYLKKSFLIIFILLAVSSHTFGQDSSQTIRGTVKETTGEVLYLANVTIITEDSVILDFALTDEKGVFEIKPQNSPQAKWIEVTFVGYFKKRLPLHLNHKSFDFILERDPNMLSEIVVKNKPMLQQFGDTLRYIVSSFAKIEDRSIGDVLKRMPGIIVDDDGTIYHNGKKIENLYIHGDDLMSGSYGTATKVIHKEMIESVDVIQNHQPIKVLKDKVFSDKTAINLVLKNENNIKLAGTAKIGIGLPSLYDISVSGILLNKKIKAINTLSSNNAGVDYSNDFKKLGGANMVEDIGSSLPTVDLSLASVGAPAVPKEYYYLNKSGFINLNNLYNFKSGLQVKFNAQGFIDNNSLDYQSNSQNFTGTDTIVFNEQQHLINHPAAVNTLFNISANKEKYFLNNTFQYAFSQNNSRGAMSFNGNDFEQKVMGRQYVFSNDFNWMPSIKKKGILEFRWLYNRNNYRNDLLLLDGFFSHIPQYENRYDGVQQIVKGPNQQSNAYSSYKLVKNKGTFDIRVGWLYEKQLLHSRLSFIDDNIVIPYNVDKGNDLYWKKNNIYVRGSYDVRLNNWQGSIRLPLALQTITYQQSEYNNLNKRNQNWLFSPDLNFRYKINQEQHLSFHYGYLNNFGTYTQVYRGAILLNYRTLQANEAELKQNKTHSASVNYNFGKSIKLFFFNAGISYRNTQSNTINSSVISNNLVKTVSFPLPNKQEYFAANSSASKFLYFFKINTTLGLSCYKGNMNQLLNNELIDINNSGWTANFKLNKRIGQYLSIDYNGTCNWNNLSYEPSSTFIKIEQRSFDVNQAASFSLLAIKKMVIDFSIKHAYSKQTGNNSIGYFFADSKIRYTPSGKKIDLTLQLSNLFNIKKYVLYNTDAYTLNLNQYNLRGRIIMVRMDYYF